MKELMDWMIESKIAKNAFNASAIVNGLELWSLATDEERKARVKLYRYWRNAGEKSAVAFEKAKAYKPVLTEGAVSLLSEKRDQSEIMKELGF